MDENNKDLRCSNHLEVIAFCKRMIICLTICFCVFMTANAMRIRKLEKRIAQDALILKRFSYFESMMNIMNQKF